MSFGFKPLVALTAAIRKPIFPRECRMLEVERKPIGAARTSPHSHKENSLHTVLKFNLVQSQLHGSLPGPVTLPLIR
jgi:hypothetical protein